MMIVIDHLLVLISYSIINVKKNELERS